SLARNRAVRVQRGHSSEHDHCWKRALARVRMSQRSRELDGPAILFDAHNESVSLEHARNMLGPRRLGTELVGLSLSRDLRAPAGPIGCAFDAFAVQCAERIGH